MRRNSVTQGLLQTQHFLIAHSTTLGRAMLHFRLQTQHKIHPCHRAVKSRGPITYAEEDPCLSTLYPWCTTTAIASWLHPTWTSRDSQACGLGESWGRHFIHSELKWDKRQPPSKLPCLKKQLHDSAESTASPLYICISHTLLGKSSLL